MDRYWVHKDYLCKVPPQWRSKSLGRFVYKADEVDEILHGKDEQLKTAMEMSAVFHNRIQELEKTIEAMGAKGTVGYILEQHEYQARLRKALEFYADKETYRNGRVWQELPITKDGGKMATEALREGEGLQKKDIPIQDRAE